MSGRIVAILVIAVGLVGSGVGYALGRSVSIETDGAPMVDVEDERIADEREGEESALVECETRLETAELALAQRPPLERAPIDAAEIPEETRAVIAAPAVSAAIEAEVERRIAERFERERARREAEWAQRRVETRERMHAIGIDDATLDAVTPQMCAIRDMFRSSWRERRGGGGGGGDAGPRGGGRRALMEQTRPLRDEVEATLGADRMARLEEEGGLRALGGAIDCGESDGATPPR